MNSILSIKYLIIIVLISLTFSVVAQKFEWEAPISDVKTAGFQRIQLTPDIISKLNPDFGDIRIIDNNGKEVPYIFESEKPIAFKDYFVEYKIIEKKEQTSWPYYTRIVIHNPKKNKISNIHLIIKNSDVSKLLKLSGSDDNTNWYIIKDNYRFQAMYSDFETSVIKIIDFPVSNYEYYEILIDDWKNNPINVLNAGFFNTSIEKGKYSQNGKLEISQLELKDVKQSLVKISYNEIQLINKLTLEIEGPEFYYRNADIQVRDSIKDKRGEFEYFFKTISNVNISSNTLNTYYFEFLKTKDIYIRISNHDDQPISVKKVSSEQLNHYLVCKLDASEKYDLRFGNPKIALPEYDIKYFSDKIPKGIPFLSIGEIKSINKKKDEKPSGIHLDNKFIWAAIIIVIILLLYMVYRMLSEMKKSKEQSI